LTHFTILLKTNNQNQQDLHFIKFIQHFNENFKK
jgi:hypothetical protein